MLDGLLQEYNVFLFIKTPFHHNESGNLVQLYSKPVNYDDNKKELRVKRS